MKKNRIIVLIAILILILGGIIVWLVFQNKRLEPAFSLAAVVSSVRAGEQFLIVTPQGKANEIKVIVSNNTKLIKLEAPFDAMNPPSPGTQFTPKQTEITLRDFNIGDEIFIKTSKNIAGKTKFNDVEFIQVLP